MQITLTATGTPEELGPILAAAALLGATHSNLNCQPGQSTAQPVQEFESVPGVKLNAEVKKGRKKAEDAAVDAKPVQDAPATLQKCADEFAAAHEANQLEKQALSPIEAAVSELKTFTLDDAKAAAAPIATTHGPKLKALLEELGAKAPDGTFKLSALDPAKYGYFIQRVKAFTL